MSTMKKIKAYIPRVVFVAILCVCLFAIVRINCSGDPDLYQTDMYTDMTYSVRVWETKSLFPDGWVFGNQLYVLATPVLAALFYGLTADPVLAMGLASTVMCFGVLLSFAWMLRPVLSRWEERLAAVVLLLSLGFLVGDPVYSLKGWQLFYTMCSYYACYLIAAFLAFGCYLRSDKPFSLGQWLAFGAACVFAFGTGMQSLRQTAVMICPLLAVELCPCVLRLAGKQSLWHRSLLVVCGLTAANVLGLVCARVLPIAQVEIFGSLGLNSIGEMLASVVPSIITALSMLVPAQYTLLLAVAGVAGVLLLALVGFFLYREKAAHGAVCLLLFTVSPLVILAIDIATTMAVRDIYYFMLIPMGAVAAALLYANGGKLFRGLVLLGTIGLFAVNCLTGLLTVPEARNADRYENVAEYLTDRGITTVYSAWNCAERVAMASDWELDAGFWDTDYAPFVSVRYLCDPSVYDRAAEECAYLFYGEDAGMIAVDAARDRGVEFEMIQAFPEENLYVYTASDNLMR